MKKVTVMGDNTLAMRQVSLYEYEFEAVKMTVSDGYHTIDELYEHRMALNIALFNMWHRHIGEDFVKVMKSRLHSDGTMFEGGYFIVMALTDHGQISYHYKLEHWGKFNIPEVERTPPYDGHSPEDVLKRLLKV